MKVQEVILQDGRSRYMLLGNDEFPIIPVLRYLKFLDNSGKSRNTQKTYCYALKTYFEFLSEKDIPFTEVTTQLLAYFVGFLRNPHDGNIIQLAPRRSAKTITIYTNFP